MITDAFNTKITLYHCIKKLDDEINRNTIKWVREIYYDCFFGTTTAQNLNGDTLSQASSFIVRIPGIESVDVSPGDVVIRGEVFDGITDEQGKRVTDLLSRYKPYCFTVKTINDNRTIPEGAHYKLTGV